MTPILTAGETCWQHSRADRATVLIDGATYFTALKSALLAAERSIFILGWDFHSRMEFEPDAPRPGVPDRMGDLLNWLAQHRKKLRINILVWDFAAIFQLDREVPPLFDKAWRSHPRVKFRFDDRHPTGACHHEKIVVIDDRIAFAGGIDVTQWRWDRRGHLAEDPCRIDPSGKPYPAVHDMQMLVDGEAAAQLGLHARERWRRATGETVPPVEPGSSGLDPWPAGLAPDFTDARIGISRTIPAYGARMEVREIERLHLAAIAAARRTIYIENQYFTSARVAEALAARLAEPDGPEVVLVLPDQNRGWLEEMTMGASRQRFLWQLAEADAGKRLAVYRPIHGGSAARAIDVHAKLLIIDDQLVRIGSSNISNRSMGLDTECDLSIEASRPEHAAAILDLRHELIAEHVGSTREEVARAVGAEGAVIPAIRRLSCAEGRCLDPVVPAPPSLLADAFSVSTLYDPERPIDGDRLLDRLVRQPVHSSSKRKIAWIGGGILAAISLVVLWMATPLRTLFTVDELLKFRDLLSGDPLAPLYIVGFFVVSSAVLFPITVAIAATVVMYPGILGIATAAAGSFLTAAIYFWLGRASGRDIVRRLAGRRLNQLSRKLARQGVLTIIALRVLPLAPFTITNLVAGASHIRFRDFLLGTIIGMTPGVAGFTMIGDALSRLWHSPNPGNVSVAIAIVLGFIGVSWVMRRWLGGSRATHGVGAGPA